jgi:hypothetical protein
MCTLIQRRFSLINTEGYTSENEENIPAMGSKLRDEVSFVSSAPVHFL